MSRARITRTPDSIVTGRTTGGRRSPRPAARATGRAARPRVRGCDAPGAGVVRLAAVAWEGRGAGVDRGVVEQLLDAQQLVVLRDALGAGRGARLDLAGADGDGEVGDRG